MSASHRWFIALGAALVMTAPLSAQQSSGDVVLGPVVATAHVVAAPAPELPPTLASEPAVLGLRLLPVTAPVAFVDPVQSRGSQSQNVAMMIVGGAGLIVGSLIDGDTGTIVMVGGGVVGLIGLYRFLN